MRRRQFFELVCGAAFGWPLVASAQQPDRFRNIGMLMPGLATEPDRRGWTAAFVQMLRNLGWVEGKNIRFDIRWNNGDGERARVNAAELVKLSPDIILAATSVNLEWAFQTTKSIPIVFTQISDPVAQGFVPDLAHPGGNVTGFAAYEFSIGGKWLDLLKQAVPAVTRVAVMFSAKASPQSAFFLRSIKAAAPAFGLQIIDAEIHDAEDVAHAMERLAAEPNGGILITTDTLVVLHRDLIVELANRYYLPSVAADIPFVRKGGLIYYGVDQENQFRQAAIYVDRILKGMRPGDLPVQLPTKFTLIVNAKASHTLGIDVPLNMLLLADEVIE